MEKKDKTKEKLLLFEDGDEKEKEEENNIEIQRRKNQAKTTKKLRGSIKFEVPKEYIKNIQIMKYSSSSNSVSSSSSLNSSSVSQKSLSEKEEEKPKKKSPIKKTISSLKKGIINNNKNNINENNNNNEDNIINDNNNNKKKQKKVSVNFNESKNQFFINDKVHASLKLQSNNFGHKEKQRKIKPVNQDKINFPFTKRIKRMTSVMPQNNEERDIDIDIDNIEENEIEEDIKKTKTLKGYKTPKIDYEIDYE